MYPMSMKTTSLIIAGKKKVPVKTYLAKNRVDSVKKKVVAKPPPLKVRTTFPETWLWLDENIGCVNIFQCVRGLK